ncbi:MAG: peptide-binding protein [Chthoniobacterales bacterium]
MPLKQTLHLPRPRSHVIDLPLKEMRLFVFGVPIFLTLLVLAAFFNATRLSSHKQNEMSFGTLGEPSTLNPIQGADAASSQVTSLVFNSLLTYDQNLEIIGDLATKWTLSQTSTLCFESPNAAASAAEKINAAKADHPDWKLLEAVPKKDDPSQLLLHFDLPGLTATREITEFIGKENLQPLSTLSVIIKGEPASAKKFDAAFQKAFPTLPILRTWFATNTSYELTVRGTGADVTQALEAFQKNSPDWKAEWTRDERDAFLAEPLVVFDLRDDVRWHDGQPFTSEDVLFTYEAIMMDEVASPRKPDFDLIGSVTTEGPHRVSVRYRKPYSPALSSWMISILPAHILKNHPVSWWATNFNRSPIGTGPFAFDEWRTNEYVRLKRNPDFFETPGPWLDSIVFRVLPDPLTLRLAFETRQVDFWGADPWAVKAFEEDHRFKVFSAPANSYSYLGWNLRRPLFQDRRIRQALAHAVNIPEMIKYVLYGHGVQSTGIFTPELWFFNPDIHPLTYNPKKAKELLAEAGWSPGKDGILEKNGQRFSFTIIVNNGNEVRRDIATIVQDNLKKIGIDVKVEIYEWTVFLKNFINKFEFDACVLGWSLSRDYDQFQIWHSSQTNPEQLNFVGYKNKTIDRLLEEIRQEYDRDTIIKMAGEMQKIIYEDQPYLFLFVPDGTAVMWQDSYRVCRPDAQGGWVDEPVKMTKAGWAHYLQWFYRPEFANNLPKKEARP